MSASNEWTEWHLTPQGWERGTEKTDFNKIVRQAPNGRVLTAEHTEYQSSTFSAPNITTEIVWRSADEAAIAALTKKFGKPPSKL